MDTTTIFVIGFVVGLAVCIAVPQLPNAIHDALVKAKTERAKQENETKQQPAIKKYY